MEWENKVEMVKLGNQNGTPEGMKAFQDFTIEHMKEFDGQAWDMYSNLVIISPEDMKKDIEYWTRVYESIKNACDELGLHADGVIKVCKGKYKQTKGYKFEYYGK